jgi:hypothetical protein
MDEHFDDIQLKLCDSDEVLIDIGTTTTLNLAQAKLFAVNITCLLSFVDTHRELTR